MQLHQTSKLCAIKVMIRMNYPCSINLKRYKRVVNKRSKVYNIFRVSPKIQNWSYFALISISVVRRCDGKKVNVLDFTFVRKSHNCWHYECTKCPDVGLRSGHSNYLRNFLSNLLAKSWQLFLLIILHTYDLTRNMIVKATQSAFKKHQAKVI